MINAHSKEVCEATLSRFTKFTKLLRMNLEGRMKGLKATSGILIDIEHNLGQLMWDVAHVSLPTSQ